MGTSGIVGGLVELKNSALAVARFNENYGGALIELRNSAASPNVIDPFPGAAFQMVFDSGQDGTQASCNGPWPYVVNTSDTSYFVNRKALFDFGGEGHYITEGIVPFFWLSHEAVDDVIPPRADGKDHGWSTKYHNILGLSDLTYTSAGTPIYFKGKADVPAGIFMMGDTIKMQYAPGAPWYRNLAEIPYGAMACRLRVSLAQAPAATASILFKKTVSDTNTAANIDDAYNAPGYHLNINKAGNCELRQFPGDTLLWSAPTSLVNNLRPVLNSEGGAEVTITCDKHDPRITKIYFNGILAVTAFLDRHSGPHFGLMVNSSSGTVKFQSREIFDVWSTLRAHWQTDGNAFRATMTYLREIQDGALLYRLNLPVIFIDAAVKGGIKAWNTDDVQMTDTEISVLAASHGGFLRLIDVNKIYSGSVDGKNGVYLDDFASIVVPEDFPGHILLNANNIALNPLNVEHNTAPADVSQAEVSFRFAPKVL